ncbi:MAG: helix-turn-helix domain-containing protein [Bacteroidaceae bacterium]|nr:helix-turn-helix domain-containing protein [Bacteroidaceae bacterium]
MERIVIINESTFTKWMERMKELLRVLHCQEQQMKNKGLGTWIDTSEVCAMLNLSKRSVQSMRERGELPYTKIEGRIYHRVEDIASIMEVMTKN